MEDDATAPIEGVEEEAVTETEESTEVEETEAEPTDDEPEGDEEGEEEEEPEPEVELEEYNFGGNKLELPKDQVPEELRGKIKEFSDGIWSDYTKKNQDISERSKSIEARESAVEKFSSLHGESLETYSQGLRVKAEIQELSGFDLNELWQSDPDTARRVSDQLSAKQQEFQGIVNMVAEQEQGLAQAQEEEIYRRSEDGKVSMERRIKGFSGKAKDVVDYAIKSGIDKSEAGNWSLNPIVTEMAYKAMMYDRAQATVKKPKTQTAQANPIAPTKNKGKSKANTNPDNMNVKDWVKWRNAQIAKKG